MANDLLDEDNKTDISGTAENTIETARSTASDAVNNATKGNYEPPTYSDEEMLGKYKSGVSYSQQELDAMPQDRYDHFVDMGKSYYKENPTPESLEAERKEMSDRLAWTDKMEKMASFVVDNTADDDDFKAVHDDMAIARDNLKNSKTAFLNATPDEIAAIESDITQKYDEANKRRSNIEAAWTGLNRGYWSMGNMIYQGGLMLKPGELTEEDSENISGSMQAEEDYTIANPQKFGGIENIHSAGDAIGWAMEGFAENVPRGLAATGMAAVGAYLAPAALAAVGAYLAPAALAAAGVGASAGTAAGVGASAGTAATIGSIVTGTLGTMALNTGEAVQDQMNENRNDGDIRNSRGWAIAQGTGYSLLDGAFGVSAWGGKIWAGLLRKAGIKEAAKSVVITDLKDTAKKATLKQVGKDIFWHGMVGEGLQEVAQSQVVGRGIRWAQTGSPLKDKESVGDAWLEAANEFAGGAVAGLGFGLIGGEVSRANAKYEIEQRGRILGALQKDKQYQDLDNYSKMLVTEKFINDAHLETTETISPKLRKVAENSNKEIEAEINNLIENGDNQEKLVGQSARSYIDIFKSQYDLTDINKLFVKRDGNMFVTADGRKFTSSLNPSVMQKNVEDHRDKKTGNIIRVFTQNGISVGQCLDKDGKPTGKYIFNNDSSMKMPVFGDNELVCNSLEQAFIRAMQLDAFNQYRIEKMKSKAEIAHRVFENMFGGRGVQLKLVDRPTAKDNDTLVGTCVASFSFDKGDEYTGGVVELDLGKIDSLGSLYTALVHERSHEDIVEFILKTQDVYKQVGDKTVIDWDKFDVLREELFAKVDGAEAKSAKYREDGAELKPVKKDSKLKHYDKVKNEWGKSAGIAGEEMVAEKNSINWMVDQLRRSQRGVIGGLVEKVRNAIGMKMAMDMGLDPRAIMGDLDESVKAEMDKIVQIGYIGREKPEGFTRNQDRDVPKTEGEGVKSTRKFTSDIGPIVENDQKWTPTVDENDEMNLGGEKSEVSQEESSAPTRQKKLKPQMANGKGASYANDTVIERADGQRFVKTENGWTGISTNETVDDATATEGGYAEVYKPSSAEEKSGKTDNETGENVAETKVEDEKKQKPDVKEGVKTENKAEPAQKQPETSSPESAKTETKTESAEEQKAEKAVSAAPEKPTEKKEPVRANPNEDTLTIEQNKKTEEPVVANAKNDTVTISQEPEKPKRKSVKYDNGLRTMPAKTKKAVIKQAGLDAKVITPEVEDRWMRLDELPDGTVIKVGGERYTKTGRIEGKAESKWTNKDGKTVIQSTLARIGEFNVVEEEAAKEHPKASEKKTESPSEAKKEEVKKETPAEKKSEEKKETEEKSVEKKPGNKTEKKEDSEPVAVSADDKLKIKQENLHKDLDDALNDAYDFVTDNQKKTLHDIVDKYGEVTKIEQPKSQKVEGWLIIHCKNDSDPKFVNKDGREMSIPEFITAMNGGEDTSIRNHIRILSMPQISDSSGLELAERLAKEGIGSTSKYTVYSDDKLLSLNANAFNNPALGALWTRWTKGNDGKIRKWLASKDVPADKMQDWMRLIWSEVTSALRNSHTIAQKKADFYARKRFIDRFVKQHNEEGRRDLYEWIASGGLEAGLRDRVNELRQDGKSISEIESDAKYISYKNAIEKYRYFTDAIANVHGSISEIGSVKYPRSGKFENSKDTGTPIGRNVTADSFLYSILNKMWLAKESHENARKEMEKRAAEEEASKARAYKKMVDATVESAITGKTIAELEKDRRRRLREANEIPPHINDLLKHDLPELFRRCVDQNGRKADPFARQAVELEASNLLIADGLLAGKCANAGIPMSDVNDAYDLTMDFLRKNWDSNKGDDVLWNNDGNVGKEQLRAKVISMANNAIKRLRDRHTKGHEGLSVVASASNAGLDNMSVSTLSFNEDLSDVNDVMNSVFEIDDENTADNAGRAVEDSFRMAVEEAELEAMRRRNLKKLGLFNGPIDAVRNIRASGHINAFQDKILRALINAWESKIFAAKENYDIKSRKTGIRMSTFKDAERELLDSYSIPALDEGVIALASKELGMKPLVYKAVLGKLLDDIAARFTNEATVEKQRNDRFINTDRMLYSVANTILDGYKKGKFGLSQSDRNTLEGLAGENYSINDTKRYSLLKFAKGEYGLDEFDKNWLLGYASGKFGLTDLERKILSRYAKGEFGVEDVESALDRFEEKPEMGLLEAMKRNGDEAMRRCVELAEMGKSDGAIKKALGEGWKTRIPNEDGGNTVGTLLNHAYEEYGWLDKRTDTQKHCAHLLYHALNQVRPDKRFVELTNEEVNEAQMNARRWLAMNNVTIPDNYFIYSLYDAVEQIKKDEQTAEDRAAIKAKKQAARELDYRTVEALRAENDEDNDAVREILSHDYTEAEVNAIIRHWEQIDDIKENAKYDASVNAKKASENEGKVKTYTVAPEPEKSEAEKLKELPHAEKVEKLKEYVKANDATDEEALRYAVDTLGMRELKANGELAKVTMAAVGISNATEMTEEEMKARAASLPERGITEQEKANLTAKINKEDLESAQNAVDKLTEKEKNNFERVFKRMDVMDTEDRGEVGRSFIKEGLKREFVIDMLMDYEKVAKANSELEKAKSDIENDKTDTSKRMKTRYYDIPSNSSSGRTDVRSFVVNIEDRSGHTVAGDGMSVTASSARSAEDKARAILIRKDKEAGKYTYIAFENTEENGTISADGQGMGIQGSSRGRVSSGYGGVDRGEEAQDGVVYYDSVAVDEELEAEKLAAERADTNIPRSGSVLRESDVEPVDSEDEQLYRQRNGQSDRRYKTRVTPTDASDPNALFGARESQEAHGFVSDKYKARNRKKYEDLRQEAELISTNSIELGKAIETGLGHGMLTDAQTYAIVIDQERLNRAIVEGRLTDKELKNAQDVIEQEARALANGLSEVGAALNAAKFGIDMRTRDTGAYIKATTRIQFEKELNKKYGAQADEHEADVEKALEEKDAIIKKQSEELQAKHDEIDKLNAKIAEKDEATDDKAIKRIADEARREGIAIGERNADEKRKARIASLMSEFGDEVENADLLDTALSFGEDIFNKSTRHAGNPEVALTADQRKFFAAVMKAVGGNAEVARKVLVKKGFSEQIALFDQYNAEVEKKAAPKDGLKKTKESNRKRIIEEQAKEIPETSTDEDVKEAKKVASGEVDIDNPVADVDSPNIVKKLENRIVNNLYDAAHEQDDAISKQHIGEFARNFFKISFIADPNVSDATRVRMLSDMMNKMSEKIGKDFSFDEADARDAILARGAFKPISRNQARVSLETLKKALALAESGKVEEAAKLVGIKKTSDADILEELDRRIGNALNKALNKYESRLNEDNNEELTKNIRELIAALNDVRSGKPVGELLGKYIKFASGMRDYRRQQSIIKRIKSRIETYERKIENGDFEVPPKRETPDTSKELKEIKHLEMDLEHLRERFKHEREAWRASKLPRGNRMLSGLMTLLAETKAIRGTFDLSSMLRQGGQLTWAHPILFYKNFWKTIETIKSEDKAREIYDLIWDRPNAKYYQKAGIDFTLWGDNADSRDDRFVLLNHYRRFTKQKHISKILNASERAFSMYLNLMRADVFDSMVKNSTFRSAENMTDEQLKALGRYINIASQRGNFDSESAWAEKLKDALPMLNTVLWSPRNVISRFQFIANTATILAPGFKTYGTTSFEMRKMFARETLRYFTGVASAILFTKLMADLFRGDDEPPQDIVIDPRSSEFMKVKIGNTRLDFLSGLQQVFVFGSRMITGKVKTPRGEMKDADRYQLMAKFARSKFSPMASLFYDMFIARETFDKQDISYLPKDIFRDDKDVVGAGRYVAENILCPLSITDVFDQIKYSGIGYAPITSIFAMLGAGANAYDANTFKNLKGDYLFFKRLLKEAQTNEERSEIIDRHPMLRMAGSIEAKLKEVNTYKGYVKSLEKQLEVMKENGSSASDIKRYEELIAENNERLENAQDETVSVILEAYKPRK